MSTSEPRNRFHPLTLADFQSSLMRIGMTEVPIAGAGEIVFERGFDGEQSRHYVIRVFTTVLAATGRVRERGDHSIRVMLFDCATQDRVHEWRVYRTGRAMQHIRQKVRLALDQVGVPPEPSDELVFGPQGDLFEGFPE